MIFFRLCKVMLISLLIKNNFYDNKLLKILLKNVYGCGSIPIKMVQWSLPSMKIMGINKDILDIFENSYEVQLHVQSVVLRMILSPYFVHAIFDQLINNLRG